MHEIIEKTYHINSYTYTAATGASADDLWDDAVAQTGLGEMDTMTKENVPISWDIKVKSLARSSWPSRPVSGIIKVISFEEFKTLAAECEEPDPGQQPTVYVTA